jgi:hypothetical protein
MIVFKPHFGHYEILGLFRIGGPGLGNLLFPYCRAHIYSLQEHNSKVIPPIWPSLKPGTFLRNEKEKRTYLSLFKFSFFRRLNLTLQSLFFKFLDEEEFLNKKITEKNVKVRVEGLRNYFSDLKGYNEQLLSFILGNVNNKILKHYNDFDENHIGVHVRLGDYSIEARTELNWYIDKIKKLQQIDKFSQCKFVIFSDGKDDELNSLLELDNCERIDNANAIADILRLSKCQIIIGSNSTFSAWATFLGEKDFIRHDKFYMHHLHNGKVYEGDNIEDLIGFKNGI